MNDKTCELFVYGTLKRGHCRSEVLAEQEFLGEYKTVEGYRLFDLGSFPGLVKEVGGGQIEGELWRVDRNLMITLDRIEGVEFNLYQREKIELEGHDKPVFAYLYQQSIDRRSDCGTCWNKD